MKLSEKQFIAKEINKLIHFGRPLTKSEIMTLYELNKSDYTEIMKIALIS